MRVPDALLRSVATRLDLDPAYISMADRFQVRDPVIEHIGWSLKSELESGSAPRIRWNTGTYRGRFKMFLNARRKLTVATRLALEPYLKGVVPGEIGALSDSLLEAGLPPSFTPSSFRARTGRTRSSLDS